MCTKYPRNPFHIRIYRGTLNTTLLQRLSADSLQRTSDNFGEWHMLQWIQLSFEWKWQKMLAGAWRVDREVILPEKQEKCILFNLALFEL